MLLQLRFSMKSSVDVIQTAVLGNVAANVLNFNVALIVCVGTSAWCENIHIVRFDDDDGNDGQDDVDS